MNFVRARLLNQQLVAPQFADPVQVVEHMGAIQAQEYRLMRWAVAMRTKKPSSKAFRKAFDSGQIVRQHLMRGTWQLISGQDWRWMMDLCAPKAKAVIMGWMKSNHISIPNDEYEAIGEIIGQTAADKGSVTAQDFEQALAEKDIHMDSHRLSYHIRFRELSGFLCSGDLDPKKATYSLASNKIQNTQSFDRDESLALLARRYFKSRCPATFEDYVWWSGLSAGDCRKGIELIKDELHLEKIQDREFLIHESCRTRGFKQGTGLLIPPYDEYLIGYKSRDIVLPPEQRHKAHNNSGIFYPIIAYDGIVCGNWSPFSKKLQFEFFDEDTNYDLTEEWERYRVCNSR